MAINGVTTPASIDAANGQFSWHNHLSSYKNMAEAQRVLGTSVGEIDLDQLEKKEMKIFGLKFTRYGQFKEQPAPRTHDDDGLQAQHAAANPRNSDFNQKVFDDAVKLCGDPTALSKDGKDIIDYAEQSENIDARIAAKSAMINYKLQYQQQHGMPQGEELAAEQARGRDVASLHQSLRDDLKAVAIANDPSLAQAPERTAELETTMER